MTVIADAAYDQLLAIYERDRIVWAAVYAMNHRDGWTGIRKLAFAHGINPDA